MEYFDFNMDMPSQGHDPAQYGIAGGGAGAQRTPVGTPMERPNADRGTTVDVSTTFQPDLLADNLPPDLVLLSTDRVHFYVHRHRLLAASRTAFAGLLAAPQGGDGTPPTVRVREPADVLNIVVHAIYCLPVAQFLPPFESVSAALDALAAYGVPLAPLALPGSPLHALVLSQAPLRPIDAYALAAHHDLPALAVPISAHLLAYPLSELTDELSERMGPRYLKRLFFLHSGRMEALKALLLHPPRGHDPTRACDMAQQQRLTRAWALASAHLVWDARPNISTSLLQAPLLHLERELSCPLCKQSLRERVAVLVREWASVKVTI